MPLSEDRAKQAKATEFYEETDAGGGVGRPRAGWRLGAGTIRGHPRAGWGSVSERSERLGAGTTRGVV